MGGIRSPEPGVSLMSHPSPKPNFRLSSSADLRARWQPAVAAWSRLQPREQVLCALAGCLVAGAVIWWMALAPALQILHNAPAQQDALSQQMARMQQWQTEAQTLQSQPALSHDQALRALETGVLQTLGTGSSLSVLNDRVTVVVKATAGDALAQWLAQARINARSVPAEVKLHRAASRLWEGTVVLILSTSPAAP
jgi:general secretion pathway protein M